MILSLLAAALAVNGVFAAVVTRSPWQKILYGCQNSLLSNGDLYRLVYSSTYSQYWECRYLHDNGGGSSSTAYCFYDYQNHTLYHYPNTPIPVDSNPSCPDTVPLAQTYLIKTSNTGKCVTMTGDKSGAAVQIRDCDYRHGNPGQKWFFDGSNIRQGNKCLDVKDGNTANGARLQTWTCTDLNANQQFYHWVHDFVIVPEDHISWMAHPGKCMDLTDGRLDNGTPIQMWDCNYSNPNQKWYIEPVV